MREKYVVAAEQLHLQKGLDHEFEKPDIVPGFFCLKAAIPEVGRWRSDRRRWRCRVERLAHDILAD